MASEKAGKLYKLTIELRPEDERCNDDKLRQVTSRDGDRLVGTMKAKFVTGRGRCRAALMEDLNSTRRLVLLITSRSR